MEDERNVVGRGGPRRRAGASVGLGEVEAEAAGTLFRRGNQSRDRNAELLSDADCGRILALRDNQQLRVEIREIKLELLGPIAGIERRGGRRRADAEERGR